MEITKRKLLILLIQGWGYKRETVLTQWLTSRLSLTTGRASPSLSMTAFQGAAFPTSCETDQLPMVLKGSGC